ncbi:VOC family protein [Amycolatopsis sp. AA4]|uniref:VOC family protein n=2 Tax=Actinomycetes TaxID=1760 RepID=UPI001331A14A|nr:VOC family protein [Amycolatopsis sp. AA4]
MPARFFPRPAAPPSAVFVGPARYRGDMATRLANLVAAAEEPARLARFWSDLLGWRLTAESPAEATVQPSPDDGCDLTLVFTATSRPKTGKNRLHLDLSSTSGENQRETVSRAVSLGARPIDIGQRNVPWIVLADPEDNEFCVLEPREEYADSGAIAAIVVDAQDPARLARFWSPLAAWPITADEPAITTLRNPAGRGPTLEFLRGHTPKHGKNRLPLDLRGDHPDETGRFQAAGARLTGPARPHALQLEFTDPEDNEFRLLSPG